MTLADLVKAVPIVSRKIVFWNEDVSPLVLNNMIISVHKEQHGQVRKNPILSEDFPTGNGVTSMRNFHMEIFHHIHLLKNEKLGFLRTNTNNKEKSSINISYLINKRMLKILFVSQNISFQNILPTSQCKERYNH